MSTVPEPTTLTPQFAIPVDWRLADLQQRLGNIPAERIRLNPPPGYATEEDVLRIEAQEDILCELEDGILVEKPMGWYESLLASLISHELTSFAIEHNLGQVLGADGTLKFLPRKVKIPDVSFISWSRFPAEKLPRRPIPQLIPDLVVEVISDSNTKKEMADKLALYIETGVRLVWYVFPDTRSAISYTGIDRFIEIPPTGCLAGGEVLAGFELSMSWLYDQADKRSPDST